MMRPWSWGMQEPSDILLLQSDCLVPPVKIAVFCYDCWNSCDGCSITSAVLVTVTIAIITTTISIAIVASVVFMYVCSPPRPPPSSSSVLPSSSALFTGFLKFVFRLSAMCKCAAEVDCVQVDEACQILSAWSL